MHRDENVIGQNVAKFRYQRGWTQDELVGKLQLLGCYMTRDILANIETQRSIVTDKQIEFLADNLWHKGGQFVPGKTTLKGRDGWLGYEDRHPAIMSESPPSH